MIYAQAEKNPTRHTNNLNKITFLLLLDSDSAFLPGGQYFPAFVEVYSYFLFNIKTFEDKCDCGHQFLEFRLS